MQPEDRETLDAPSMDYLPLWYCRAQQAAQAEHAESADDDLPGPCDSLEMLAWVMVYAVGMLAVFAAAGAAWWLA